MSSFDADNQPAAADGRRIARNTLFLYARMLVMMAASLLTSRILLDVLGEVDFGLYGAVGGVVIAFSFLAGVLSSACTRYFAIELGRNDYSALHKVFNLNVLLFAALCGVALLLSESVGLWFVRCKMVFPPERLEAVNWVYQLSVLTVIAGTVAMPFRALVIARENMKVFAYSSVVEAVLKLGFVYALTFATADSLILYSFMMLGVNVAVSLFYVAYCWRFYAESRFAFYWDASMFRGIVGYTGWNVIGSLAMMGKSQGVNLLLNVFFGPVVNAARAIAYQVFMAIGQFSSNFVMAASPQITKLYSAGQKDAMLRLVCQSSKYSYLLLYLLVMPVVLLLPRLLEVWLVSVPEHTLTFTRLMLVNALVDSLSLPTAYAMQATGKVKWYQLSVGTTLLLIVPVSYILLRTTNCAPELVLIVGILLSVVAQVVRVCIVRGELGLSLVSYARAVLVPLAVVTVLSPLVPCVLMSNMDDGWLRFVCVGTASVASVAVVTWFAALEADERASLVGAVRKRFFKQ